MQRNRKLVDIESLVKGAARTHGVPGASVAVLKGQTVVGEVATGVINRDTRVRTTTDTVFQIGSITKTFTATMIMQLRDERRLDLDEPVVKYLPEFRNNDMKRLRKVTLRHLLTHQSGIDGDFFPRTDTGDKAIEELLGMSDSLPFLFDPGSNYSYNNIGFSALGRVIEVLDQRSFDSSLRKRIFVPLEMNHALSRPEDNLRFRAAVGHLPNPERPKQLVVPKITYLSIGQKAAGSTPAMTAADLLKYAAVHKNKGVGLNGNRILSAKSVREMQKPQVSNRDKDWPWQVGLPWRIAKWGDDKVYGHPGGTVGQASDLTICNEKDLAVVCLTNGGNTADFFRQVVGTVWSSVNVKMFMPPNPDKSVKINPELLTGRYRNIAVTIDVTEEDDKLMMAVSPPGFAGLKAKSEIGFVNSRLAIANKMAIEMGGKPDQPCDWIRIGGRMLLRA
jgi:CubicO group peptidase (beta-lactamase class C family)